MNYDIIDTDGLTIDVRGSMCWGHFTKNYSGTAAKLVYISSQKANDWKGTVPVLQGLWVFAKNKQHFTWTPRTCEIALDGFNISELKLCLQFLRAAGGFSQAPTVAQLYRRFDSCPYDWPDDDMRHGGIFDRRITIRTAMWRLVCLGESPDYEFVNGTTDNFIVGETVIADSAAYRGAVSSCTIRTTLQPQDCQFPHNASIQNIRIAASSYLMPNMETNDKFFQNILVMPPTEATELYYQDYRTQLASRM